MEALAQIKKHPILGQFHSRPFYKINKGGAGGKMSTNGGKGGHMTGGKGGAGGGKGGYPSSTENQILESAEMAARREVRQSAQAKKMILIQHVTERIQQVGFLAGCDCGGVGTTPSAVVLVYPRMLEDFLS